MNKEDVIQYLMVLVLIIFGPYCATLGDLGGYRADAIKADSYLSSLPNCEGIIYSAEGAVKRNSSYPCIDTYDRLIIMNGDKKEIIYPRGRG